MAGDDWWSETVDLPDEGNEVEPRGIDGSTDPSEIPVEPETWGLESAAFVLLGVAVTLFVFLRFAVG